MTSTITLLGSFFGGSCPGPPPQDGTQAGLTLSLMDLNKAIVVKDKNGHVSEDAQAAWYPASSYLNAVDFVHGLGDFQRYLLQHTLDDGTRVNPADPPASMNRNEAKIFGNVATFAGVGVNITWDPATGLITYRLDGLKQLVSEQPSSTNDIEQQFIIGARDCSMQGYELLIEEYKGE